MSPSPSAVAPELLPTSDRSGLHKLAGAVRPLALAGERILPVLPALEPLLPERGLRRGSIVGTTGSPGATSLALALISAASTGGSWCAAVAVGRPAVGFSAAVELGIALERFPLVSAAGGNGPGGWAWVVAALLDAIDVIVTWPPAHLRATDARRLAARARERGSVLVIVGRDSVGRRAAGAGWPAPVDLQLRVSSTVWHGVGRGHGRLEARSMQVVAGGRGAAARERRLELWLPSAPAPASTPARTDSVCCTRRAVMGVESTQITAVRVHETAG